tara:strand:- start:173 stop:577 length:405 start_codon:yes stop_codon:yes gene_type:complete
MEDYDDDVFDGLGIEIELNNPDDFLKVRETLTRMGVSSRKEKKLYQSCHILHKRGKYAILHFKEFFILDGLKSDISEGDLARRNTICRLLEEWGLLNILDDDIEPQANMSQIKIIPHKEKNEWELVPKYHIGRN